MICAIDPNNNFPPSIQQEVEVDVQKAELLLKAVKVKDATNTTNKLKQLLIEYIIANMKGDQTETKELQSQIGQTLQQYGQDIEHANALQTKLEAMAKEPGADLTPGDLSYLESLLQALQADTGSGDMSNLTSFFNPNSQTTM